MSITPTFIRPRLGVTTARLFPVRDRRTRIVDGSLIRSSSVACPAGSAANAAVLMKASVAAIVVAAMVVTATRVRQVRAPGSERFMDVPEKMWREVYAKNRRLAPSVPGSISAWHHLLRSPDENRYLERQRHSRARRA